MMSNVLLLCINFAWSVLRDISVARFIPVQRGGPNDARGNLQHFVDPHILVSPLPKPHVPNRRQVFRHCATHVYPR